jgi:hypothetical protein
MDRYDEAKHIGSGDEPASPIDGDILGIRHSTVPKEPGDPTTQYDEESKRKRRERAFGSDDAEERDRNLEHGSGATGIDMGGGGSGTDVSGS